MTSARRRPRQRVLALVAALGFGLLAMTGCEPGEPPPFTYFTDLPIPEGSAPMRYRDEVFASFTKTSDVVWGEAPDRNGNPVTLKLDMYEPAGDLAARRPVVIVAHSGGFKGGSKTNAVSVDLAQRFARKGYVALSINYRLLALVNCGSLGGLIEDSSGCKYATLAATSDGQAAIRWARANADTYRLAPDKIAMVGDSAGALMSVLSGMLADVPRDYNDPLSLEIMYGAPPNVGNLDQSSVLQAWASISGGLPPTETVGLAQRLMDAPTPTAPGYLFAATADNQTPHAWSVDTRDVLVEAGVLTGFKSVVGGHVPYSTYKTMFNEQIGAFFYYMLTPADLAG